MSRTDIRIGIPESASYRPEAHVFPFPCRVGSGFLFFLVRNWISSPNPLATRICNTRTCVSKGLSDLITIKGDIFREGIIARDKVTSLPKDVEYISMYRYETSPSELSSRRSVRACACACNCAHTRTNENNFLQLLMTMRQRSRICSHTSMFRPNPISSFPSRYQHFAPLLSFRQKTRLNS